MLRQARCVSSLSSPPKCTTATYASLRYKLAVRLSLALSGSLLLSLALSGSLWLSQALSGSPNLLTKPLLGSQGPSALKYFNQPCTLQDTRPSLTKNPSPQASSYPLHGDGLLGDVVNLLLSAGQALVGHHHHHHHHHDRDHYHDHHHDHDHHHGLLGDVFNLLLSVGQALVGVRTTICL